MEANVMDNENTLVFSEEEIVQAVKEKQNYSRAEKYDGIKHAILDEASGIDPDTNELISDKDAIKKAFLKYCPEELYQAYLKVGEQRE